VWSELAAAGLDGAELWDGGELEVDGADELWELLGVVEGAELCVVGALDADVVGFDFDDDADADPDPDVLCVEADVLGAVAELLVAVGDGAELPDVRDVVVRAEGVSDVASVPVAAGTDAAGGVLGLWLPLPSTSTRAVAKAAITAVANAPTTKPAPPLRRFSGGGSPTPTRSVARPGTGGNMRVEGIGGLSAARFARGSPDLASGASTPASPAAIAAAAPAPTPAPAAAT